jgi:hypothetical protein
MLCTIKRDEFRRVIYVPGDGVGVVGGGPMGWLSESQITPHTKLFHFFVIGDYIAEDDDYVILESIGKGTAVGRLSWYADKRYTVFRMNDPNFAALGELAAERASVFGRRHYDYALYVKLFAWALGYWTKELATGHWPPRPVRPEQIPYKTDRDFICIELYFAIWNLVGRRIRAHGHAPVPGEVIDAVHRGRLVVIDHHNGNKEAWRTPRGTIKPPSWATLGKAGENITRGDLVGLGTDGLVYSTREEHDVEMLLLPGAVVKPSVSIGGGVPAGMKVPEAVTTTNAEGTGYQQREPSEEFEAAMNKRKFEQQGPDLVARQLGQKRNKIHVYRQPFGYPIRLCDWTHQEPESLAVLHTRGPNMTLKQYLDEHTRFLDEGQVCLHCWHVLIGDRTSVGMDNHGRGKGAPTP